MPNGYGLSDTAIELYNLLIAFGWTPQAAYTFAQKYDLAYDVNGVIIDQDLARVIDDTIAQLEQEYETAKAEAITQPYEYKKERPEPTEPTGGPPLSAYPIETIEQALLNFVPGPGDLPTAIATKDLVPGVDFRTDIYGPTVETWAAKRAQEIKWGVGWQTGVTPGELGKPLVTPEEYGAQELARWTGKPVEKPPAGYVQPTDLPPYPGIPPTAATAAEQRAAEERAAERAAAAAAKEAKRIADEEWEELRKRLNRPERKTEI